MTREDGDVVGNSTEFAGPVVDGLVDGLIEGVFIGRIGRVGAWRSCSSISLAYLASSGDREMKKFEGSAQRK